MTDKTNLYQRGVWHENKYSEVTDKLKKDLPNMLKEHKAIIAKLKKLAGAAKKAKRPEFAHFTEKLMIHAQTEEEVLYPATILIGEFIRLKLYE